MAGKIEKSAWDKTLSLLNRRALNQRMLATKLREAGYPGVEIRAAVERALQLKLVDDELLAQDYARSMAVQGSGRYRIRQKLQVKQFDAGTIAQAVEQTAAGERANAELAFERKMRLLSRETDWRKKREKMFRHLIGRGFPAGLVRELAQRIRPESAADDDGAWSGDGALD